MKQKRLILFMPTIEDGGVEKNLFMISNYLATKVKNIPLITISDFYRGRFKKKIKIVSYKSNLLNKIGRRKKFLFCLFLLFFEIIKKRDFVVLCFQGNLYCTLLCKLFGIKIIVRSNSAPEGWSRNFFKQICFKYIFKLSDEIIVNSVDFKKKFKTWFNLKTTCIYNPLNKKEIIKQSKIKCDISFDKKKLNIINVARLADQKDQITLLKALNEIKNKINFNLIIVGNGVEKNRLINYVDKNDLSKKVKFVKFRKNPFNLIALSELFVLSSIYEGLPNVLIEAQALKKFIISSNCPTGPNEILLNGKAGLLFKPRDYKKLAKLILYYSRNRKRLQKRTLIGYKNLNRFDYFLNLQKYYNVVNSLIN